jgi:flavodoxin
MHDVLVFYATSEGQTRRIAERIAADMRARGFGSRAIDVTTADAARVVWDNVRGVLLGASLHAGRHQAAAIEFAQAFRDRFNMYPSAFFSVSLSAASANRSRGHAARSRLDRLGRGVTLRDPDGERDRERGASALSFRTARARRRLGKSRLRRHDGQVTQLLRYEDLVRLAQPVVGAFAEADAWLPCAAVPHSLLLH